MPIRDHYLGSARYALLLYLGIYLLPPILGHTTAAQWAVTAAATVIFLPVYFAAFRWYNQPRLLACVAVMAALGMATCRANYGASTFFVYAAAFAAFAPTTRQAVLSGAAVLGALAAAALLLQPGMAFWLPGLAFSLTVGATNLQVAEAKRAQARLDAARAEVEYLGKVAERERIARDLHDVLGHTLSVVALKVELAGKLISADPARAQRELDEVQAIAREALAEVRQAIGGYRGQGLQAELARAAATLESAGVRFSAETGGVAVAPADESVLALALREAVTNIVRHARATRCRVVLEAGPEICSLRIEDDGVGGAREGAQEGNGLRGMRERVEVAAGSLRREAARPDGGGTRLVITLPRAAPGVKVMA